MCTFVCVYRHWPSQSFSVYLWGGWLRGKKVHRDRGSGETRVATIESRRWRPIMRVAMARGWKDGVGGVSRRVGNPCKKSGVLLGSDI